jgi:signal peptidase I
MQPFYNEGQIVWVNNWAYLFSRPKIGEVIVFNQQGREFIKRIAKVEESFVEVLGDNVADSLDSRQIGMINHKEIKGKVFYPKYISGKNY